MCIHFEAKFYILEVDHNDVKRLFEEVQPLLRRCCFEQDAQGVLNVLSMKAIWFILFGFDV